MTVTATELKLNLGKYLDMMKASDNYDDSIIVTKNGKEIAELRKPRPTVAERMGSLLSEAEIAGISYEGDEWRDAVMEEQYGITL